MAEIIIKNQIDFIPKISVIMPLYNVSEYIEQCLDSVTSQSLKEIEVICVDDGSTDNTIDLVKEYAQKDNRITLLSQENSGSGKARNNGIKNASGEFIAFMDADDLYPYNHTLELMYNKAISNDVNICGGSLCRIINDKIEKDSSKIEDGYIFKKDGMVKYTDYQFDWGYWRFIYKTNLIRTNELYFPDYLRGQDPPFFIKAMSLAKSFYSLKEATYCYRVSHKEVSWTERKVADVILSYNECLELAKQFGLYKLYYSIIDRANSKYALDRYAKFIDYPKVKAARDLIVKTETNKLSSLYYTGLVSEIVIPNIKKYYLFNLIPMYKIKKKNKTTKHYLFGFLPYLKIKEW